MYTHNRTEELFHHSNKILNNWFTFIYKQKRSSRINYDISCISHLCKIQSTLFLFVSYFITPQKQNIKYIYTKTIRELTIVSYILPGFFFKASAQQAYFTLKLYCNWCKWPVLYVITFNLNGINVRKKCIN